MGARRQGTPKGRGLGNAGRRPGYARTRQGLGNLLSSAQIRARLPGAPEDGRLQGGGPGKPGRAPAQVGQRLEENKVGKKLVGAPRQRRRGDLPGGRGECSRWGWGRGGSARGGAGGCALLQQIREPRPRGLSGQGGTGATPAPPPRAQRGDPPSLRVPSSSYPRPAPPAPGALTWKRFFTHSFFMAGEGAGRAAGRGGDGRGRGGVGGGGGAGGGGERTGAAPVAQAASGAREPRRGEGGGRAQSPPLPRQPAPHLAPLPWPAPLRPLGQLSPAFPHPHPASASQALDTWGN